MVQHYASCSPSLRTHGYLYDNENECTLSIYLVSIDLTWMLICTSLLHTYLDNTCIHCLILKCLRELLLDLCYHDLTLDISLHTHLFHILSLVYFLSLFPMPYLSGLIPWVPIAASEKALVVQPQWHLRLPARDYVTSLGWYDIVRVLFWRRPNRTTL